MERFQYFGEFDSFRITGCSKLANEPAEGYKGAMSYALRQWSLSRDGGFRLEDVLRVAREE